MQQQTVAIDVETTSLELDELEIFEFATLCCMDLKSANKLFGTKMPIPASVSALTHIISEDVSGIDLFDLESAEGMLERINGKYVIAHNAKFDVTAIEKYGHEFEKDKIICTLRMAKKLLVGDREPESLSLGTLRYALELDVPRTMTSHRAADDAYVCAKLFEYLVDLMIEDGILDHSKDYCEQIVEWLSEPIIVKEMPFGKHKGKLLEDIPMSYWDWALGNLDSLNEESSMYDDDFAQSVIMAVEKIIDSH